MEFRAHLKNVHMSPRKMRLVRSVIHGLPAREAAVQLTFLPGKAAQIVLKVLRSAMANARHNFDADESVLTVDDLIINKGVVLKRWRPVSKGMAHPILKRMSHVTVVLGEAGAGTAQKVKRKKTEIADISAADHIAQGTSVVTSEAKPPADESLGSYNRHGPDKKLQAYQKIKTLQHGGDRAKTQRRKSLSDSK